MTTVTFQGVTSEIARVHRDFRRKTQRGGLINLATAIGLMPGVRRLVREFNDTTHYPQRPMITLHDAQPSVYLLGWRESDWTEIHDHGDCEVGIYVIQGEIVEDIYATVPDEGRNRKCLLSFSRTLREGDAAVCPRKYLHAMGNIFPETAATLHVYGPTLSDMNLYEVKDDRLEFQSHWHDRHQPQH